MQQDKNVINSNVSFSKLNSKSELCDDNFDTEMIKYEKLMRNCKIYLFKYNKKLKQVTLSKALVKKLNVTSGNKPVTVMQIVGKGKIHSDYICEITRLFEEIDNGVSTSACEIALLGEDGNIGYFSINVTAIPESDGVWFAGAVQDITQRVNLQKEKAFANNIICDKTLLCEANLTNDDVNYINEKWAKALNIKMPLKYSKFINETANILEASFNNQTINDALCRECILNMINNEESNLQYHFKLKNLLGGEKYLWYEFTTNYIVQTCPTGKNVYLRIYVQNINEKKKDSYIADERRKIYKNMLADNTLISYEMNLTEDNFIRGNEKWLEDNKVNNDSKFSAIIASIVDTKVYEDDKTILLDNAGRQNMLLGFSLGKSEFNCEYRRLNENGEYKWWSYKAYLYQDPDNKNICGFVYVQDIDNEKTNTLSLKYDAEHDLMTGLYNKVTTEKNITKILQGTRQNDTHSGMVLIDLDNFKQINDSFGHEFGDEVIKEICTIIKYEFRQDDIVGRIGGDEFCVFAKGLNTDNMLEKKAVKLCKTLQRSYTKNGVTVEISASIGIAFVNENDNNYKTIAKRADDAMYRAKKLGKNRISY